MNSIVYNKDCMLDLVNYPDKHFDLVIADPPYGGSEKWLKSKRSRFGGRFDKYKIDRTGGTWSKKYQNESNIKHWDVAPDNCFFEELFRISKNQIIWGGNYFELPATRCFLVWRKLRISEKFSMSMCEYAWASFDENAKMIELAPQDPNRFHPTQKPVKLYEWILKNYAKAGDKILDPMFGSGSSRIACHKHGFDYTGYELDTNYFNEEEKRWNAYLDKQTLFQPNILQNV